MDRRLILVQTLSTIMVSIEKYCKDRELGMKVARRLSSCFIDQ